MKIAEIKVDLIDLMGTDLTVVNAAKVSFAKESQWEKRTSYGVESDIEILSAKDEKLIKYLADHNHWSPFAHCFVQFRIKAPIFVARQLVKHQVGLTWNEVSRRYVDYEPEFYFPKTWRKRAENKKQGSLEETVDNEADTIALSKAGANFALATYNSLLRMGVCPEQARMALPQNMMTEWYWSGSLYAFARVCNLRLDPEHVQRETIEVAEQINKYMSSLFPVSWKYLVESKVQWNPTSNVS